MTTEEEQRLDGHSFSSARMKAMMDLINWPDTNPDDIRSRHSYFLDLTGRKVGTMFIASTVEDMDRRSSCEMLWNAGYLVPVSLDARLDYLIQQAHEEMYAMIDRTFRQLQYRKCLDLYNEYGIVVYEKTI